MFDDANIADIRAIVTDGMLKELGQQVRGEPYTWADILNKRSSASMFDSITFVRKDVMEYLSLIHGFANPESRNILKPVVQSSGMDPLLFGKTVFIYDPGMDSFFSRNPKLDILMTKTAAKLFQERAPGEGSNIGFKMIKPGEANTETIGNTYSDALKSLVDTKYDAVEYFRDISTKSVVVKADEYSDKTAKKSLSLLSTMSEAELKKVYDEQYGPQVQLQIEQLSELYRTKEGRAALFTAGLGGPSSDRATLDALMQDTGIKNNPSVQSTFLSIMQRHATLDPLHLNRNFALNQLYNKFIEPILNQSARVRGAGSEDVAHGLKSVLIQSLNPVRVISRYNPQTDMHETIEINDRRPLDSTIVDKKQQVIQVGEAMLPAHAGDMVLNEITGGTSQLDLRFANITKSREIKYGDRISSLDDLIKTE